MIAKISATENLGGALGYNFKKVNKKEATLLLAHGLYQNRAGEYTMSEVLADMQALILEKCRTKKTVFHCSLNPHPVSYTHLDVYKRQLINLEITLNHPGNTYLSE